MDSEFAQIDSWLVALLLAAAMFGAWVAGWFIGRRHPADPDDKSAARFVDGSLALLGLLLGFSFAMALSKHEHRREMFIADCSSIGDFYTSVSFLPDPARTELQETVREYVNIRLNLFHKLPNPALIPKAIADSDKLQDRMTHLTVDAVHAGTPATVPLVNTLNALQSSQVALIAAMHDRLPVEVFFLLAVAAVVSSILVGIHHGTRNRMHVSGTISYVLLAALAVCVILDLNQPDRGLITVNYEPLERLAASIAK